MLTQKKIVYKGFSITLNFKICCLIVSELENMASVETVSNTFRAINDGGSDRSQAQNGGNQENSWQGHSEGSLPRDYGSTSGGNEKRKCLYTPAMEDALRRRLKFFFMDPCSKFRARRHWPWKLSMQVLKIVIITVQVRNYLPSEVEWFVVVCCGFDLFLFVS